MPGPFAPWAEPTNPGRPLSLVPLLARATAERPDHPALVGTSGQLSFAELDRRSAQVATALASLGVDPGDRVALCLPNDLAVVTAVMGVWRRGAVSVGVHRALAPPEKEYFLDDSGAVLLLAEPAAAVELRRRTADRPALRRTVVVDPGGAEDEWGALVDGAGDDAFLGVDPLGLAAIAYTSGTTGRPKGVMHSQHNALLPGVVSVCRGSFGPDEPIAVVHPLTILNLMVLNPLTTLSALSTCVLLDRHDAPSIAAAIGKHQVACISCVPTIFFELLTHPRVDPADLASLTKPRTGGSGMSEEHKRLFTDRFGVRPVTSYALTEGPTLVTRQDEGDEGGDGDLGRPLPHVTVEIRDAADRVVPAGQSGEICFGPRTEGPWAGVYRTMLGYWGLPEESVETLRGGVVHSGDIGRLEPDGRLVLVDRRSQLIIRGGSNIYPAEIERVLAAQPGVADCCVVGRPDERYGEVVVAAVQRAPDSPVTAQQLRAACAQQVASYKVPDEIQIFDALPRGPLGKVARQQVAELLA